jgi:hypothetical protein
MTALVLITGSVGILASLAIAFWHYGKAVREAHLELLAKWFRDEPESFNLFFYQQSLKATRKEIALQKQKNDNTRITMDGSNPQRDGAGQSESDQPSQ